MGGSIECGYYAFGEHDIVFICEMPSNGDAAAMALAAAAGGSVSSYKTTVLLTPDEATQAMQRAADSVYRPATA